MHSQLLQARSNNPNAAKRINLAKVFTWLETVAIGFPGQYAPALALSAMFLRVSLVLDTADIVRDGDITLRADFKKEKFSTHR
jgi:hypothetical protein